MVVPFTLTSNYFSKFLIAIGGIDGHTIIIVFATYLNIELPKTLTLMSGKYYLSFLRMTGTESGTKITNVWQHYLSSNANDCKESGTKITDVWQNTT